MLVELNEKDVEVLKKVLDETKENLKKNDYPLDENAAESHKDIFIKKDAPRVESALNILRKVYPDVTTSLGNMEIEKTPFGSYRRYPLENVDGRMLEIWCGLFENRGNLYKYKVIEWSQPSHKSFTIKGFGDNMLKKWARETLKYKKV